MSFYIILCYLCSESKSGSWICRSQFQYTDVEYY